MKLQLVNTQAADAGLELRSAALPPGLVASLNLHPSQPTGIQVKNYVSSQFGLDNN